MIEDITKKNFLEFIENLKIESKLKYQILTHFSCLKLLESQYEESIFKNKNKEYSIFYLFNNLGTEFKPLLNNALVKQIFIEYSLEKFQYSHVTGTEKNIFLTSFFDIYSTSEHLGFINKNSCDFFISIFKEAVKLKNKNEEQSITYVLNKLFDQIEVIDKDFFKEIFSIYIDNINPNQKYFFKINKIKNWARKQDFSTLSTKYKNIRNFLNSTKEEQIFLTSSKNYDLGEISRHKKLNFSIIENLFISLNLFLKDTLIGNKNIRNFIVQDEKIYNTVLIVYSKRDHIVESATKLHDIFFEQLSSTTNIDNNLIKNVWDKLVLNNSLVENLKINNLNNNKNTKKL